jgi:hypothetical protein
MPSQKQEQPMESSEPASGNNDGACAYGNRIVPQLNPISLKVKALQNKPRKS